MTEITRQPSIKGDMLILERAVMELAADHYLLHKAAVPAFRRIRAALTEKALPDVTDIDVARKIAPDGDGQERLWTWFGLSRASFLALPRVLMHAMPDDWQGKMAALLDEYDEQFPNGAGVDCGARVVAHKNGKFSKWPEWLLNYRHPDSAAIQAAKDGAG